MSFKIESPKDVVLVLLFGLCCVFGTGWFYTADNSRMTTQINLTGEFLQGVNWNQQAVALLNQIGYREIEFRTPPKSPVPPANAASEDSTGSK